MSTREAIVPLPTSKSAGEPVEGIAWNQVRESLPSTAHDLLDEIRKAYEQDSNDPAHAIELALQARLTSLEQRFASAKKDGPK
jgi:hypothetical protein